MEIDIVEGRDPRTSDKLSVNNRFKNCCRSGTARRPKDPDNDLPRRAVGRQHSDQEKRL